MYGDELPALTPEQLREAKAIEPPVVLNVELEVNSNDVVLETEETVPRNCDELVLSNK